MTTIPDLRALLRDVTPHMGTDDSLPMLCGIKVEADDRHLYLIATDRYTLAATRRAAPGIGTWSAFLDTDDVKAITALGRIAGTRPIALSHDGRRLTARVGGHALTLDPNDTENGEGLGSFPRWRPMVREALAAAPDLTTEVALNARFLARWGGHLRGTDACAPCLVWGSGIRHKPIVITRGEDFIGLQMPIHLGHTTGEPTALERVRDAWNTTLTADRPAIAA
ncbi:hypothetical protein [Embleya sp. NBC_00896]|uniref:hypothetical protein n=1 Tax=Embleya sp. NBC_00896 TaxID=2975961 RepID=UPI00386FAD67|nr:hypothetical protein OG928_30020 [Embleya sp. NBC_00896]